jgi:hypothetical protein
MGKVVLKVVEVDRDKVSEEVEEGVIICHHVYTCRFLMEFHRLLQVIGENRVLS